MAHGRKYYLILAACLFGLSQRGLAQQAPVGFAEVDSISYSLYAARQWDALAAYSRQAAKSGYDYYYLRIRAGIAYFEKEQYRAAAAEFEKALGFNAGDALAGEYLYYSYLYSNRAEQARWLSRSFDTALAAQLKTQRLSPIAYVMAEGGVKLSDSSARFGTATYAQAGISHFVARRFSLFHAVTYYRQNEQRFNVQQFQYFINAALPLKKGFLLSGGFHFIHDVADVKRYRPVESVTTQTVLPPPGTPLPPPGTPFSYTIAVHSTSLQPYYQSRQFSNYAGAVTLIKHTRRFDLSIGTTASFLDTASQYQLNGGITYYPFQSNRFSIGANAYAHNDTRVKKAALAVAPWVSFMPLKKTWLSLAYFNNNGLNIAEQNGYLVNNSTDYTTERYTASLSYGIFKKVYIYGTYGFENKKILTGTFKYNYNIFLLGIKVVPS